MHQEKNKYLKIKKYLFFNPQNSVPLVKKNKKKKLIFKKCQHYIIQIQKVNKEHTL